MILFTILHKEYTTTILFSIINMIVVILYMIITKQFTSNYIENTILKCVIDRSSYC